MWDVVAANPWLVPVCLLLVLATVVWLHERTLSRTKPGDDAQVRLFWLIRIGIRRGLPPADPETTPEPDDVDR
jgi:hypothetical protein